MFTGIIEEVGEVIALREEATNVHFSIRASFVNELQIDQSVAHDGVCLTVTEVSDDAYVVCAIKETLDRTALSDWEVGAKVNLERAMKLGSRIDGHMVQGHVDDVGKCIGKRSEDGSWVFEFQYAVEGNKITVPKGSICVNGISLTVVRSEADSFSVAIIPYTYEHTNLSTIEVGGQVNLEFDIIGKYVARIMEGRDQNTALAI